MLRSAGAADLDTGAGRQREHDGGSDKRKRERHQAPRQSGLPSGGRRLAVGAGTNRGILAGCVASKATAGGGALGCFRGLLRCGLYARHRETPARTGSDVLTGFIGPAGTGRARAMVAP